MKPKTFADLLAEKPVFVNLGVRGFAESLHDAGFVVVHVDWSPPAGGDPEMAAILDDLM
jgi:FdrA protein